jgi:hypothetical protein
MITIYQIRLTHAEINSVNRGEVLPKYTAKMNTMISAKKFTPSYFEYYTPVCKVHTDDLEHAFEVTNLWNEPDLVKYITASCSSSSVGDIFQCGEQFFIVDSFGFKEIFPSQNEIVS